MLTMTLHTDRTKPTARGKWILEVLLGSPPPPANAGSFSPPDKKRPEPESFRKKLGQHTSNPNYVASSPIKNSSTYSISCKTPAAIGRKAARVIFLVPVSNTI